MANALRKRTEEGALTERMLLGTLGRPGFMALNRTLGRETLPHWRTATQVPRTTIGSDWVDTPKGVRVMHGSHNPASVIKEGFKRGDVFVTPSPPTADKILHAYEMGKDATGKNILISMMQPDVGIFSGSAQPTTIARALGLSNFGEQEMRMSPYQANKFFNVGPKPSFMRSIINAVTPTFKPNNWIGPWNVDEALNLTKDDLATNKTSLSGLDPEKYGSHSARNVIAKTLGYGGRAIPFAGAGLGAVDVTQRVNKGDWLGAGLSGLGMVPVAGIPALAGLAAYDAYDIVNNPRTGPEPMRMPSAFTTPQYGPGAYRN